jgi:hypothetical protein
MPKAKTSKRTRRVRNRAVFSYDGDPCEGEGGHDITIAQSAKGHVLRTTHTSKLETETSINSDFADPWTTGFFDFNTEAAVVDSSPVWTLDELLDSDPLESQPEPEERHMVRMSFTFECSLIDKNSYIRPSRHSKPGKCGIVLRISMSYSVIMVELVNPHAHSVKIAMAFTSARNVSAVASIVRCVSLNDTHFILCIRLRCVLLHICQDINLMYPVAVEWLFLRANIPM